MNAIQKIKLLLLHSSMTLDRAILQRTADKDKWDESKHPRKQNGQFGKGGAGKQIKKSKRGRYNSSQNQGKYYLTNHIRSELNTHLSKKQRKQKIIHKAIGDYYYTIENNGFDNYRIIDKIKID